jgi:hypothetical protein
VQDGRISRKEASAWKLRDDGENGRWIVLQDAPPDTESAEKFATLTACENALTIYGTARS